MTMRKGHWEFYRDVKRKWRWRRLASNGRIIAASTEGYSKRSDCVGNARRSGFEIEATIDFSSKQKG